MRSRVSRGNALVEFTLVGIPLVFALFSIFEMARGMWIYDTVANSIREGSRFAMVKGQNCAEPPNSCAATVSQVAQRIQRLGVGLNPNEFRVTLTSLTRTVGPAILTQLLANNSYWPSAGPSAQSDPGGAPDQPISISGTYPFQSAIAMFWPGAGGTGPFRTLTLGANSSVRIQF
jgi:Flp pilus assembly protein TadG